MSTADHAVVERCGAKRARTARKPSRETKATPGVSLDNLTLSRKEGFRAFVEHPARTQPELLSEQQLASLTDDERRRYNRRRSVWHANLPFIQSTQVLELHNHMSLIVESNQQDGEKAKGAIAIEGPAGTGKSTATLVCLADFHRGQIAELGRFTDDGNERWPVCRVGMTGDTGMKDFNRATLGFYNHAGTKSGSAADFADRALDCVRSCETKLLVVDDLHFLKQRTTSIQISNQFKYISNEFPLTIIFIGIGLRQRGLYSDGAYADGILGQSGRRITPLVLRGFDIDTDSHRYEWQQLLKTIEKRIVLTHRHRGMLVKHADLLFERTSGRIGPLTTLINRACFQAVRTGSEYIDKDVLDQVPLDAASDQQRSDTRARIRAFAKQRTSTP
jgi:hypothetical protein